MLSSTLISSLLSTFVIVCCLDQKSLLHMATCSRDGSVRLFSVNLAAERVASKAIASTSTTAATTATPLPTAPSPVVTS
jgi:hypothetical protein